MGRIFDKRYTLECPEKVIDADYFYFDTAPDPDKPLGIVFGGYEKCAFGFEIKKTNYPFYVIDYVLSGTAEFILDSVKHHLEPGMLMGLSPSNSHHLKCLDKKPMEHVFVAFTGTEAGELMAKSTLTKRGAFRVTDPDAVVSLFELIRDKGSNKTSFSHELCRNYLKTLLLELGSDAITRKKYCVGSMATYQLCKTYIDSNFSNIMHPNDAAKACSVDVRYISQLFKRYQKISPHEYIMRLKLNRAANLLLITDLEVKEVGHRVGFTDPYHFSRNFKKVHGLSPNQYRQVHLK